jgi:hypothetical protein
VSEARELLASVYGWFSEGFNTRDLKEAKESAVSGVGGVAVTDDGGHNGGGSCHFSRTICPLLL